MRRHKNGDRRTSAVGYIQKIYRKTLKNNRWIREAVSWIKVRMRYGLGAYARYQKPGWRVSDTENKEKNLKIAVICDKFTWINLKSCFQSVYLTPANWRQVMEREHPDILLCEAAWEGLDGCWVNEILRNPEFLLDNRLVLKDILRYCRAAGIQTIFWNKEDTPGFDACSQSFVDTALLFDHIFTTTEECIAQYRARGHQSVHLMMFGFLPELFYPANEAYEGDTAVFLGSWYGDQEERCEDMRKVFEMVLKQGLKLKIYDRMSQTDKPVRQYPKEYQPYLYTAVPYEQTGDVMRRAGYVININTVKNSETMFARRVFEAMACGKIVISNESTGLRKLFSERIWFADEAFDHTKEKQIIQQNLETVNAQYTFKKQFMMALESAGIYLKA